jgi:hypothetical protein
MLKLLYVEFKEPRAFRQVEVGGELYGLNINLGTSTRGPILYAGKGSSPADGWDLQRAGTSLTMTKGGCTYECPWDEVKNSLQMPEPETAKAGAKPGKPAAQ